MRVKAVVLALALMTSLVSLAEPADKTVWRVGVFDGSSGDVVVNGHTAHVQETLQPQKKMDTLSCASRAS